MSVAHPRCPDRGRELGDAFVAAVQRAGRHSGAPGDRTHRETIDADCDDLGRSGIEKQFVVALR
jgi:hypothetical protein